MTTQKLNLNFVIKVIHRLTLAAQPALVTADLAFKPLKQTPSAPTILDKEVRAIFVSFFARILHGYRRALQFTRIHPRLQTRLMEDRFLDAHTEADSFKARLTKSQSFQSFVETRGVPYRLILFFNFFSL